MVRWFLNIHKMDILFANNYYYMRGGSERILFEERALLRERGHVVRGFSHRHSANIASELSEYFLDPVNYDELSGTAKIKQAVRLIVNKEAAQKFTLAIEEFKPDIVHAHNIYGGLTTSVLDVAKKKNVPSVITLHDCKLICPSYLMLNRGKVCDDCKGRKFYHCLVNRCHKNSLVASAIYTVESYYNKWFKKWGSVKYYICPSRFLLNKMAEGGLPREKLVYIPNFVDVSRFAPSFEPGGYVLYVGRLSHEKGVLSLLKALRGAGIPLRIVGDGPVRQKTEEMVNQEGLKDITFEGYQSGEKLADLFRNAAFLVMPSEWYENAPVTLLEAYAYGKPVIGSRIGGIPEMIEEGETGELFESGNIGELREKILTLWESRKNIVFMGQTARKRLQEKYSPEIHYSKLIEVYQKALEQNRS